MIIPPILYLGYTLRVWSASASEPKCRDQILMRYGEEKGKAIHVTSRVGP
jgi:hypothetical protein